jgi:hypothetical protein
MNSQQLQLSHQRTHAGCFVTFVLLNYRRDLFKMDPFKTGYDLSLMAVPLFISFFSKFVLLWQKKD